MRPIPISRPSAEVAASAEVVYETSPCFGIVVPGGGVEPPRPEGRRILSPMDQSQKTS